MSRILRVTLVVLLAVCFLVAGNGGGSISAAKDPMRAYEGTTLKVLLKQGYETTAIEKYVHEFEALTGIDVQYEVYDEPGMRNKFVLDSTTKAGAYDVTAVQFWYFPEYDRARWLEPLDDYIKNKTIPGLMDINQIPGSIRKSYIGKKDGKLYAVPVSAAGGLLTYRKDILSELGLKAPKSVEDVVKLAQVIKEKKPGLYGWVSRGESSFASFSTSAGWAWAYGARILDENNKVTVNTPEMKRAMTDFVTLCKDFGPPDQASLGWDAMSPIFGDGKAVFNFDMSGFAGFWASPKNSKVADRIDVAVLTGPAKHAAQWFYSEALGISKFSKNKEAAWLFIQWRMSKDILLKEVKDEIRLDIPYDAILKTSQYTSKANELGMKWYTDALPGMFEAVDLGYWPAIPEFVKVAEAFQKEISLAISGKQSVDTALKNAQKNIEQIMKEAGY